MVNTETERLRQTSDETLALEAKNLLTELVYMMDEAKLNRYDLITLRFYLQKAWDVVAQKYHGLKP